MAGITETLTPLVSLSLNTDYSLSLTVSTIAVVVVIVIAVVLYMARWWWFTPRNDIEFDSAALGIGAHSISFRPNRRDQEIAYKIWVELSTRKIGLEIDLKHDVIVEIYDSWHHFFSVTRELIKDVPVSKLKSESTRKIITLSVSLLNEGLRPHLTAWQARFRRWYELQLENAPDDVEPQTLQRKYAKFDELAKDILAVNQRLIVYREKMRELVLGLAPEAISPTPQDKPSL
jgi:hypothetical protein